MAPELKEIPGQTVIAIEHQGGHDEIGQVYHKLHEWARSHNITPVGPGITIFRDPPNEFDPQSGFFEVCLPVAAAAEGDASVKVKQLPACTVAAQTVEGPYHRIPAHYTEILAWLSSEGKEIVGPPREVYIKRPSARGSGDPGKYLTEIQFPVST